MRKVNVTQVKSSIRKRGSWKGFLCPSKCYPNPGSPFNMAMEIDMSRYDTLNLQQKLSKFDKIRLEYELRNCNTETGKRVHFYEAD
jgi:hypothetical protein